MSSDWQEIQGPCFLSHSYDDEDAVSQVADRLRAQSIEPVIFNLADANPANPVSNDIVPTILSCESQIYLQGGHSANSFWVRFERDYALRSGLAVFAYEPHSESLEADKGSPMDLNIRTYAHQDDQEQAEELLRWMREERNFNLRSNVSRLRAGSMSGDTAVILEEMLIDGGAVLFLCNQSLLGTLRLFFGPSFQDYLDRSYDFRNRFADTRMSELEDLADVSSEELSMLHEDGYFDRENPFEYLLPVFGGIDPTLTSDERTNRFSILNLLSDETESGFDWNAIDDLIIRLFQILNEYPSRVRRDAGIVF